jgi:hypothetical protein
MINKTPFEDESFQMKEENATGIINMDFTKYQRVAMEVIKNTA